MSRTTDPRTLAAIALVMAGKPVADVARETGCNRSNLWRALARAGLKTPVKGRRGPKPRSELETMLLAEG